jgi:hypothetical protein
MFFKDRGNGSLKHISIIGSTVWRRFLRIEENAPMVRRRFIDFDRINADALVCLEAVCRRLLPDGRREGNEYVALNPRHGDRHLGSFRINLANGRWADFALADKSARGGDPISLVAYVLNIKQSEAARGLMRVLGMESRQ